MSENRKKNKKNKKNKQKNKNKKINRNNITTTKLKEKFEEIKSNLEIFLELKENEKLGKEILEGKKKYYKVEYSRLLWLSRWYYGEGRTKTLEYLDEDFTTFMKFNTELLENMDVDLMGNYNDLAEEVCIFIKKIIDGLNNLKTTYTDFKEMSEKIDNIIITLLEFKEKSKEIRKNKDKENLMLRVTDNISYKYE